MTPHCASSDSTAMSAPASAPVCEAAALAPAAVRPDFTARMGLVAVTRRAICTKRFGFPKLSRYIRMTLVRSSCSQYSSRSLPETSALFPSEANIDRPSPRSRIAASTASPSAPDCDEKAMFPGSGVVDEKVACRLMEGSVLMTPMQLGPTMRIPYFLETASSADSSDAPDSPISLNPAVITMRPRTPFRPQDSAAATACWLGTTRMARSTGPGMSSTEA